MDKLDYTFCKVFIKKPESHETSFYEGYFYISDNDFVVKFKSNQKSDNEIVAENKILYITIGDKEYTFYDIYKINISNNKDFSVLDVFARKKLVGLFSDNPNEEEIKEIEIDFNGIHHLFTSELLDHQKKNDKSIIDTKMRRLIIDTSRFKLEIFIWHPLYSNSSNVSIGTKTVLNFKYHNPIKLFEAISDVAYFQSFIAFCSNNIHKYTITKITKTDDQEFSLKSNIKIEEITTHLFALSYRNIQSFEGLIYKIFEEKDSLQFVFNQYYKTSIQIKSKDLSYDTFNQWVSIIELIYNVYYQDKTISDYNSTIRSLTSVINGSNELSKEEKNIAINRLTGIIDNPLKEKIVKVLSDIDKYYYEIDSAFLNKTSDFIKKIINTRNVSVHPNKSSKEVFSSLEVDKMNCLFKHATFISICKNLGVNSFGDYYYEKIKYFFDVINYNEKTKNNIL